eukprot:824022-Pyramimonas_sp.AAC.1
MCTSLQRHIKDLDRASPRTWPHRKVFPSLPSDLEPPLIEFAYGADLPVSDPEVVHEVIAQEAATFYYRKTAKVLRATSQVTELAVRHHGASAGASHAMGRQEMRDVMMEMVQG